MQLLSSSHHYRANQQSVNVLAALTQRSQYHVTPSSLLQSYLPNSVVSTLNCDSSNIHSFTDPFASSVTPTFVVRYHPSVSRHLLAAADEDGWVSLLRPSSESHTQTIATRQKFHAHANAIFDLVWVNTASQQHSGVMDGCEGGAADSLITVSGDQSARGWDVESGSCLYTLMGHKGSVKAVRVQPSQPSVVLTGSRDGNVLLFDIREPIHTPAGGVSSHTPYYTLKNVQTENGWATKRKRTIGVIENASNDTRPDSHQSVTSLSFISPHVFLTAGASSSEIRAWDLRYMRGKFKRDAVIVTNTCDPSLASSSSTRKKKATDTMEPIWQFSASAPSGGSDFGTRKYGVSSLSLDNTGTRLIASSRDHSIYLYDLINPSNASTLAAPQQIFQGHMASSFYVKAAFSPDGRFISSGSGDSKVYIWDTQAYKSHKAPSIDALNAASAVTDSTSASPTATAPTPASNPNAVRHLRVLTGHANEVGDVAWAPFTSFSTPHHFQLASCGDDSTVRIWNVDRDALNESIGDIVPWVAPLPAAAPIEIHTPVKQNKSKTRNLFGSDVNSTSNTYFASPLSSTTISTPSINSSSSRSSVFSLSSTMSPASTTVFDSPLSSTSSSAISPCSSSQQLLSSAVTNGSGSSSSLRSLSPSNRLGTSSSLTASLERQMASQLTVSPTKVQLARNAHRQARHRLRMQTNAGEYDDEEDDQNSDENMKDDETSPNAPTATTTPAVASSLPFSLAPRTLALNGAALPELVSFAPAALLSNLPSIFVPPAVIPTISTTSVLPVAAAVAATTPTISSSTSASIPLSTSTTAAAAVTSLPSFRPASSSAAFPAPSAARSTSLKRGHSKVIRGKAAKPIVHVRPIKEFFQPKPAAQPSVAPLVPIDHNQMQA